MIEYIHCILSFDCSSFNLINTLQQSVEAMSQNKNNY